MESEYSMIVAKLMRDGWGRQSAQDRAADIIQRDAEPLVITCGGVAINYKINADGSMSFL